MSRIYSSYLLGLNSHVSQAPSQYTCLPTWPKASAFKPRQKDSSPQNTRTRTFLHARCPEFFPYLLNITYTPCSIFSVSQRCVCKSIISPQSFSLSKCRRPPVHPHRAGKFVTDSLTPRLDSWPHAPHRISINSHCISSLTAPSTLLSLLLPACNFCSILACGPLTMMDTQSMSPECLALWSAPPRHIAKLLSRYTRLRTLSLLAYCSGIPW